jgi:hypothetical protein
VLFCKENTQRAPARCADARQRAARTRASALRGRALRAAETFEPPSATL